MTNSKCGGGGEFSRVMGRLEQRTNRLTASANGFASAMSRAFMQATTGGRSLDDVLGCWCCGSPAWR